jgi:hypothetical protein
MFFSFDAVLESLYLEKVHTRFVDERIEPDHTISLHLVSRSFVDIEGAIPFLTCVGADAAGHIY